MNHCENNRRSSGRIRRCQITIWERRGFRDVSTWLGGSGCAQPRLVGRGFSTGGGVEVKLPDETSERTWTLRVGVAAITRPVAQADDGIGMADHSHQMGLEKALSLSG